MLQWIVEHEPVLSYGNVSVAGKLFVTTVVFRNSDKITLSDVNSASVHYVMLKIRQAMLQLKSAFER